MVPCMVVPVGVTLTDFSDVLEIVLVILLLVLVIEEVTRVLLVGTFTGSSEIGVNIPEGFPVLLYVNVPVGNIVVFPNCDVLAVPVKFEVPDIVDAAFPV